MKLEVIGLEKQEGEKPKDFFVRYFKDRPATRIPGSTDVQCKKGKLRSYSDLWAIYQHYYPDNSELQFKDMMIYLIQKHFINAVYCGDIGDVTFFPYGWSGYDNYSNYCPVFMALGSSVYFCDRRIFKYYGYDPEHSQGKPYEVAKHLGVSFLEIPEKKD